MIKPTDNKNTIAITGATGYIAEGLIEYLLQNKYRVNAIARNEGKLTELKWRFRDINIFPCPVEDYCLLKKALSDVEGIFHLASSKDVVLSEEHVLKTVQTNIVGTLNVLKLSRELPGIKFVLATNTDKSVKVTSVYGATKLISEGLFWEYQKINSHCKYRTVRLGNVFYSTGSVLTHWKEALRNGKKVYLTDPVSTRYFMTRDEAIDTIFKCLDESTDPTPYYAKMKSIELQTLLDIMIEKYGTNNPDIELIGLQSGENQHESLDHYQNSLNAERWPAEQLMKIL